MSAHLTFEHASSFLAWCMLDPTLVKGELRLICLQGITPVGGDPTRVGPNTLELNGNEPDRQNDTLALMWKDDAGGHIACCVGTLEPGRYYTIDDPNPEGAAHVTFGEHLYVPGYHKQDPNHPCLRAKDEQNRIWRDKNGNFSPDMGEFVYVGAFGTNIHAGSKTWSIGKYSAGCITFGGGLTGEPYKEFLRLRQMHIDKAGGRPVRVCVWRGRDLAGFTTPGHRPTLLLGMKNGWVAVLQRALTAKGFTIKDDGDWREGTTKTVAAFQKANGLTVDGVVGPKTWEKLYAG